MRSLNWIKSFYALDKQIDVPTKRTRYIAISVMGGYALYAWVRHAEGIPVLLACLLAVFLFVEPINFKFFKIVSFILQIVFQTLRIMVMSFLYYTLFALFAVYYRRTQLIKSSFNMNTHSTFRKTDSLDINWRKMY